MLYYLPKGLLLLKRLGNLDDVPFNIKNKTNAVDKHDNYCVLTCKTVIPLIVNILENSYLPYSLYDNYGSNFYDAHDESFNILFRNNCKLRIKDIERPSLFTERGDILMKKHTKTVGHNKGQDLLKRYKLIIILLNVIGLQVFPTNYMILLPGRVELCRHHY